MSDKDNEKDNLGSSNLEATLNDLARLAAAGIARATDAQDFKDYARAAQEGREIAEGARKQLEAITGQKVITSENFLSPNEATFETAYRPDVKPTDE